MNQLLKLDDNLIYQSNIFIQQAHCTVEAKSFLKDLSYPGKIWSGPEAQVWTKRCRRTEKWWNSLIIISLNHPYFTRNTKSQTNNAKYEFFLKDILPRHKRRHREHLFRTCLESRQLYLLMSERKANNFIGVYHPIFLYIVVWVEHK